MVESAHLDQWSEGCGVVAGVGIFDDRLCDAPILSNPVLVRCEGGEPLVVSGGEVVVVVEASFEP